MTFHLWMMIAILIYLCVGSEIALHVEVDEIRKVARKLQARISLS